MIRGELAHEMERLLAERVPFVTATVIRAARPTSVRVGDAALVLADGTIEGFVGGVCAQASVRLYAARVLETGDPVILRLIPGDADEDGDARDDTVVAHNPCLSGGTLEIFLEPQLPASRVLVAGDTPVARAVADIARAAGYAVLCGDAEELRFEGSDAAAVVASHGDGEEAMLVRALDAGVGYVALVASEARGAAVLASLDVPDALREQVHTPAGLDIGARTPADIAIAILAEMVATRTAHVPAAATPAPATAIDPVCGMTVVAGDVTVHLDDESGRVYFCCEGCRATYAAAAH